jgi:hypothetical protein
MPVCLFLPAQAKSYGLVATTNMVYLYNYELKITNYEYLYNLVYNALQIIMLNRRENLLILDVLKKIKVLKWVKIMVNG